MTATARFRHRAVERLLRVPATGPHRVLLAYVVSVTALLPAGLLTLLYLLVQDCEGLECVGEGALLYGIGTLVAGGILVMWGRRVGLGAEWAVLTWAGWAVLGFVTIAHGLDSDPVVLVTAAATVALPAVTAWVTHPGRPWWMRVLGVAVVAAFVWASWPSPG